MSKLREDRGVAVIVVLLAVVILSALGATLTITSLRDLDSSTSVQRSSSALGVAEAGVQHALERLKDGEPLPGALISGRYADASADGFGYWMNPADATQPPPAYDSTDPVNKSGPYEGIPAGSTGKYVTYIKVLTPVNIDAKTSGLYRIVSTGVDRRDSAVRPGIQTVWQDVKITALDIPFTMFAEFDYRVGGQNVKLRNLSVYTGRDMFFRDSLTFEATPAGTPNPCSALSPPPPVTWPTGCDLIYRHDTDDDGNFIEEQVGPAAAHSLKTIYKGNGAANAANGPIHLDQTLNCGYPYDRDSLGALFPASWPCNIAPFNAPGPPPYEALTPCPTGSNLKNRGSCFAKVPFDPNLPNEQTYQQLKALAKLSGRYYGPGTGTLTIKNVDLPANPPTKFFVVYVEGRDKVSFASDTQWGPQVLPPETIQPPNCDGSMGIVVVRNGDLTWNATAVWWGAAFVPEGEFAGGGGGSDTWFVGTVKAKNIGSTGNIQFQMNNCWKQTIPGFAFSISRERWHQPGQ